MARTWTGQQIWQQLSPYQRAAAMAIMEADGRNPTDARNVLGAIINRSQRTGDPLGEHVSKPIYQPTIEMSQFARLPSILKSQQFQEMTALAEKRDKGEIGDWVQGATHFLASEKRMMDLYNKNPDKYHNWGPFQNSRGIPGKNWTGYDPATGEYKGVIMRDGSHAFLAPEGLYEGTRSEAPVLTASAGSTAPPPAAPAASTASAPSPLGGMAPEDRALLMSAQYLANDESDDSASEFMKGVAQASNAAMRSAQAGLKSGSPMIQGPRTPRIDMQALLSVLKQSGVSLAGAGPLGSGVGNLGTRRT